MNIYNLSDSWTGHKLKKKREHLINNIYSTFFVSMSGYGTRSTSVVLWDIDGKLTFSEITWSENGSKQGYKNLLFKGYKQ